jgi:polysaccharide pyruvyl transferase WcaK-like protein
MIHHVFANRSNIGDWLSARGIQHLLAPHRVVEHLCDDPFVDETLAALRELSPSDLLVIGGGGLLMDYFAPFWRGVRPIAERVPTVLWGIGCVDLKQEASRLAPEVIQPIVRAARLCVVRDTLTRELLGGTVPPPVPCPSLVAVDETPPPGDGFLHVANYTTVGAVVYDRMRAESEAFAERAGLRFRETNNRIEPDREAELAQRLSLYRRSSLVASSALHGCIIAVAMGRPVLAVSGDRKIDAFMQAAGLGSWVLAQDGLNQLTPMLGRLATQPRPALFVAAARQANRDVAARVLALLPLLPR